MDENIEFCDLCLRNHKIIPMCEEYSYKCENDNIQGCIIHESVKYCSEIERQKRYNAIYNFLYDKPFYKGHEYWRFFYEETDAPTHDFKNVNVFHLMRDYPKNIVERVNRAVVNLNKLFNKLSDCFSVIDCIKYARLFYIENGNLGDQSIIAEVSSLFEILCEQGYITKKYSNSFSERTIYSLSFEGISLADKMQNGEIESKQIFIAMSFNPKVSYIEECFKKAIWKAKYSPMIIKDKEHNNYIMPEIFHEIDKSVGVVVDITEPNYGAYYEAGYALGKQKEVIVCCSKEVFDDPERKPHFDLAQKSMIVWTNNDDLVEKLSKRISATMK